MNYFQFINKLVGHDGSVQPSRRDEKGGEQPS
jgi:hypothetical protein